MQLLLYLTNTEIVTLARDVKEISYGMFCSGKKKTGAIFYNKYIMMGPKKQKCQPGL
jgi:hypothetical protein